MTETTPRLRFTDVTWQSVGGQVTPDSELDWAAVLDLGGDLAELVGHLTVAQCRLLVDHTHVGLPMVVTFDTLLTGLYATPIERRQVTVVADRLVAPTPGRPESTGRVRIRYSGFCHDLPLAAARSVQVTPTTTTYHAVEQEPGDGNEG